MTVDQFRLQKRGGVGLKSIRLNDGDALAAINTVTHLVSQRSCSVSLTLMADTDRCQDIKMSPLFGLPAVVALTVQEGFANSRIRQRRRGQFIALVSGLRGVLHKSAIEEPSAWEQLSRPHGPQACLWIQAFLYLAGSRTGWCGG